MEDVSRLKAWVAKRFGDGSRPPSGVVPEFTEEGFPHVHIVQFGETFIPHSVLSSYWDGRRDRGTVVWCDAVVSRGDAGDPHWRSWASPDTKTSRRTLRETRRDRSEATPSTAP